MRPRRDTQQLDQVLARAVRIGDHPVRAADRPRHEHPHALVADARVGLGKACVDQVVDGHHPPKAPLARAPCSPGCARGPRPRGWPAAASSACSPSTHCIAVARADRHRHGRQQLAPRPGGASCLAVDERREAHAGRRLGEQRRNQLTCGDLHPARLPRDEEDQVQADVGWRRAHGSAPGAVGARLRLRALDVDVAPMITDCDGAALDGGWEKPAGERRSKGR